jgi:hypothetical protein
MGDSAAVNIRYSHIPRRSGDLMPFQLYVNAPDAVSLVSISRTSPLPHALVLARRLLARLELVQVPSADGQAALVVVHALAEVVDVGSARAGRGHLGSLRHLGCVLVGLGELGVLGRGVRGGRRAAAEPAADGVANRRTDCDTAVRC